jgi:hypothetical protein
MAIVIQNKYQDSRERAVAQLVEGRWKIEK